MFIHWIILCTIWVKDFMKTLGNLECYYIEKRVKNNKKKNEHEHGLETIILL